MTRQLLAAAFASVLLSGQHGTNSGAAEEMLVSGADDNARTFAEAATDAGTAAGIVNQCRTDAAPIRSAFARVVDAARLDPERRQSLWLRYESAEASTLAILAKGNSVSCNDTNGIIQNMIHELEGPLS